MLEAVAVDGQAVADEHGAGATARGDGRFGGARFGNDGGHGGEYGTGEEDTALGPDRVEFWPAPAHLG
jgi:hypothetical protein